MKRILCIAMAAALLLTLGACGSERDALIGRWQGQADIQDVINEALLQALEPEVRQHISISAFPVTMYLVFQEDDTYSMTVDAEKLYGAMDGVEQEVRAGLEAYFASLASDMGQDIGGEALLAGQSASLEAILEEAFAPEILRELVDTLCTGVNTTGNYRAEDGRLYMTDTGEEAGAGTFYDDYVIEGDTLTILAPADSAGAMLPGLYPMVFTRIPEK